MVSASGGDSNEENSWWSVIKGNHSVNSGSQLERSVRVASDRSSSNRSDMKVAFADEEMRSMKNTPVSNDKSKRKKGGGESYNCHSIMLSREALSRRRNERLCFECGQPWHVSRECPERTGRKDPY